MCNPYADTMKISCRYHRLLIYDEKRTTNIDGMDPFNAYSNHLDKPSISDEGWKS